MDNTPIFSIRKAGLPEDNKSVIVGTLWPEPYITTPIFSINQ